LIGLTYSGVIVKKESKTYDAEALLEGFTTIISDRIRCKKDRIFFDLLPLACKSTIRFELEITF